MRRWLLCLLVGFVCKNASTQEALLDVRIAHQKYQPGDTVSIDADFTINGKKPVTGTLYLKAVNQEGKVWNLRWPILDGVCNADVIIPDSFPPSSLTFFFAATHNFFSVSGEVISRGKISKLKGTLLTKNKDMLIEEFDLVNNKFTYSNRLFEEEATLFLKYPKGSSDDLEIRITSLLDSFFVPIATQTVSLTIGNYHEDTASVPQVGFNEIDSFIGTREKMLAPVLVTAKRNSRTQQFNDQFSTGLFRSIDERVLNIMDDPSALAANSIITFLQGRIAGLRIERNSVGEWVATWRNDNVIFYVDEMRLDATTVSNIPVFDIAIVKAYPPPFFGNPGGNGGAVAIYTKRAGYYETSNRRTFRLKGYSPSVSVLTINPKQ